MTPSNGEPSTSLPATASLEPRPIPYEVQAYPMPTYPTDVYPASSYSGRGYPNQLYPPLPPADVQWPLVAGEPPPVRRRPLRIAAIVLTLLVVIGGGGVAAYQLIVGRDTGPSTPAVAVEGFLGAVFTLKSAKEAATFVCPRARNAAELDQVVFDVKTFEKDYPSPRTTWTYPQIQPDGDQASASVTLTLTTANEQVARKEITLLLVDDRGWYVCDVLENAQPAAR
jgi:hypothetical protein